MVKLKLGPISDDKPVKLAVELPAAIHRDLLVYSKILARETGQLIADPSKLVPPMLARFMATAELSQKPDEEIREKVRDSVLRVD